MNGAPKVWVGFMYGPPAPHEWGTQVMGLGFMCGLGVLVSWRSSEIGSGLYGVRRWRSG
jgi:hypothetical protein